ncbi:hypothetical protein A5888_004224 [Enterococcus sp. 9E7_DIV0242]|uniref:Uncharacterized protein n=1 Tax=Candidatus Enterococcus clewellii TaxID=1834193 RepID=A0A242K7E9_9ENTE|nr:hypothetical protein A5888_002348 [Enterococcus sp. 9E7_DIV0242]
MYRFEKEKFDDKTYRKSCVILYKTYNEKGHVLRREYLKETAADTVEKEHVVRP